MLDSLPLEVLQQCLCEAACARTADALAQTNKRLYMLLTFDREQILPMSTHPERSLGMCCPDNVVRWNASEGTLLKTPRLGHPAIIFAEPLRRRSLLLELLLEELPSVGGVQLGVIASGLDGCIGSDDSTVGWCRRWFDGTGRAHARDGEGDGGYSVKLCGERVREGDRIGVCYLAASWAVGFTLNGVLMSDPLPLPTDGDAHRGRAPPPIPSLLRRLHFYCRFDCVDGTRVRVLRDRTGFVDEATLRASVNAYVPRPPPAHHPPKSVLVRTVGPDSRYHVVALDPRSATVGDLHAAVLQALGVDDWHSLELRVSTVGLTAAKSSASQTRLLLGTHTRLNEGEGAAQMAVPLTEIGLGVEDATGRQLRDLIVSVPHLIS